MADFHWSGKLPRARDVLKTRVRGYARDGPSCLSSPLVMPSAPGICANAACQYN